MIKSIFFRNLFFTLVLMVPQIAKGQVISTEEKFQDLFVSAGYGTVYGAALGAALLSFQTKPENNLKLVALGASIGFISGSLLGSYIIISPVLETENIESVRSNRLAQSNFTEITGIKGSITLFSF